MTLPHNLVECALLLIGALVITACPQRTQQTKNEIFFGGFGERFEYSPKIAIDYNPHGGANRAVFSHDGAPIGIMSVTAPPPEGVSEDVMKDVIIESTKKQYSATAVKYSQFTNRSGYTFHHYSSDAQRDGVSYRYEMFLHIDKRKLPSMAHSFLAGHFGMHKFEFIIPDNRFTSVMPLLNSVIDSFTPVEKRNDK